MTLTMTAIPIFIVTSYLLYKRREFIRTTLLCMLIDEVALGEEQKKVEIKDQN